MTITRADVEALLSFTNQLDQKNQAVISELCRTWLAVDDAPSGETWGFVSGMVSLKTNAYIPAGTYKLVCIETPAGVRVGREDHTVWDEMDQLESDIRNELGKE